MAFFDEARKRGWEIYGIDYSLKVINYGQKKLNLEIRCGGIFKFRSKHKFDVNTLNQVIEHLSQPNTLMRRRRSLLNPGGLIYLATPNIQSVTARAEEEYFDHIVPSEHVCYYEYHSVSRLLKNNGFKLIYSPSWSYRQDLAGIQKIFWETD